MAFSTPFLVFFFTFIFSISTQVFSIHTAQFVVWNVGQGSWSTLITQAHCDHFDMGGEFNPISTVMNFCKNKENRIYLSHLDWDHISFIARGLRTFNRFCLANQPRRKSKKSKYISRLPKCSSSKKTVEFIFSPQKNHLSENESSHVFTVSNEILIPGDSTKKMEKLWSPSLSSANKIRTLLLGHHGSHTSTSQGLLNHLPHLAQAVASSRRRKYGHPHKSVSQRLKKNSIALLKTENWGHIHFEVSLKKQKKPSLQREK